MTDLVPRVRGPTDGPPNAPMALATVVRALLAHPRIIVGTMVAAVVVPLALLLLGGRDFVARSSFTPESQRTGQFSQLAGIAAQFGFNLPTGNAEPVKLYMELVTSHDVLVQAVRSTYRFPVGASGEVRAGTLAELYGIEGPNPGARERRAVRRLRRTVSASFDREAQLVTVSTEAPWPGLAEALNARLLELVGSFNSERRESRWRAEREFVGHRLEEARAQLDSAGDRLTAFLQRNRFQDPAVETEQRRLQNEFYLQQQVVTSLAQSYEEARIAEVRNTPVISIVQHPEGTARPAGSLILDLLIWLVLGSIVATGLALGAETLRRFRETNPEEARELQTLAHRAVRSLAPRSGVR